MLYSLLLAPIFLLASTEPFAHGHIQIVSSTKVALDPEAIGLVLDLRDVEEGDGEFEKTFTIPTVVLHKGSTQIVSAFLATLQENSTVRKENNPNWKSEAHGAEDLQLREAINIVKDMIFLASQKSKE